MPDDPRAHDLEWDTVTLALKMVAWRREYCEEMARLVGGPEVGSSRRNTLHLNLEL